MVLQYDLDVIADRSPFIAGQTFKRRLESGRTQQLGGTFGAFGYRFVKGALQLTPEQQKYWPPVENAIRARAEDRRDRFAKIAETMGKRADESPAEVMGNRDPIAFLQRRAEALAQRSADLKNKKQYVTNQW